MGSCQLYTYSVRRLRVFEEEYEYIFTCFIVHNGIVVLEDSRFCVFSGFSYSPDLHSGRPVSAHGAIAGHTFLRRNPSVMYYLTVTISFTTTLFSAEQWKDKDISAWRGYKA